MVSAGFPEVSGLHGSLRGSGGTPERTLKGAATMNRYGYDTVAAGFSLRRRRTIIFVRTITYRAPARSAQAPVERLYLMIVSDSVLDKN